MFYNAAPRRNQIQGIPGQGLVYDSGNCPWSCRDWKFSCMKEIYDSSAAKDMITANSKTQAGIITG